jgi:putative N6-adenine-specific DNA methylase
MTYIYQKTNRYFAQTAEDIKDIAEEELISLGAEKTRPVYRGIHFSASPKTLYSINYHSRLINRVLAPLVSFICHSDQVLYNKTSQVRWADFLNPSSTFAVFATVTHSSIRHSKFAALRLKDSIVDTLQNRTGRRPSVDIQNPDIWINLYIENDEATISIDTSGGSLHRRGYREKTVQAPMIETLAAAVIHYSGWDGKSPMVDPFCGSGTLLCEGFLFASHTPPAFLRKRFGFERLPDFDSLLWNQIKKKGTENRILLEKGMITGSDISAEAVRSSTHNCSLIDKKGVIEIKRSDVFNHEKIEGKTIICNPPYGIRMDKTTDLCSFYKKLGDFLKRHCIGSTAYIYFGERKYLKNIGLKPSWKKPLSNGGLDGRLVKFNLY